MFNFSLIVPVCLSYLVEVSATVVLEFNAHIEVGEFVVRSSVELQLRLIRWQSSSFLTKASGICGTVLRPVDLALVCWMGWDSLSATTVPV